MKIGYARCSTEEQNLDAQIDALEKAGCDEIFSDQGVSGVEIKRERLTKALKAANIPGGVLVVWNLDRLGRSLSNLIDLMDQLRQAEAGFNSLSEAIDTTTAGGKLIFHVMGALAEFERSLISERTKEGMKAARRRGKHLGRPPALTYEQVAHAKRLIDADGETISGMASVLGVDRKTLRRALQKNAVKKALSH